MSNEVNELIYEFRSNDVPQLWKWYYCIVSRNIVQEIHVSVREFPHPVRLRERGRSERGERNERRTLLAEEGW